MKAGSTPRKGRVRSLDDPARRYVFTEPVRCPTCRSTRSRTYKTAQADDGSGRTERYKRCLDCGDKFIVVAEDAGTVKPSRTGETVPTVYVGPVRCPHCSSIDVRTYRSCPTEQEGMTKRYAQCCGCGKKFYVIRSSKRLRSSPQGEL